MNRPTAGAPWPTASTRAVVLLGWPARYSLSPVIHNAAFAEDDLDLVYLVAPCRPGTLAQVMPALTETGVVGANVTVPHKRDVVAFCDELSAEAELIGAVNTLAWTADGVVGDNTDARGLLDALTADVAFPADGSIVLLGTGGAARAAAVAAGRLGARLTVVGRRADAAASVAELATRAGAHAADALGVDHLDAVAPAVTGAHVVMNATPLGMDGESLPAPFHTLGDQQVAYDLIYDPPETPFLRDARACGAAAHHGLGMLVAQAAASYARWTGQPAPEETMSAVAAAALLARRRGADHAAASGPGDA